MDDATRELLATVRGIPSDRLWFDPMMLTAATYPKFTPVTMPFAATAQIAPADANRWAIGFSFGSLATGTLIAPWSDIDSYGFATQTLGVTLLFYTLFDFGPLVCSSWYGKATSVQTIRLIELIRKPG